MKQNLLFTSLLGQLLLLVSGGEVFLVAAPRPNILIIVADDLGYADIGVHGGAEVPTPNIDRLANAGMRFTDGYVTAPYCSPSRAGFISGRAQTRFGHEFNPHEGDETTLGLPINEITLPDVLHENGYATSAIGKWHLGFSPSHHPLQRGFDHYLGFLVGGHNFLLHADAQPRFGSAHSHDMIYRNQELLSIDGYTTDLFTEEAINFINQKKAAPWFVYLAYNAVHTPLEVAHKHRQRIPAEVTDPDRVGYLSLLLGLDDAIGELLGELERNGEREETIIFFFGDNGGAGQKPFFAYNTGRNRPLRGDKGQMLEGGIRVPYFVSWPEHIAAGKISRTPVSTLDIFPTCCELAGVNSPDQLEGVSLLPWLKEKKTGPVHESLYWRFGIQKAVRQGDWKLVDWRDFETEVQSGWQLYNLSNDIAESQNLADQHPDKVAALSAAWEEWNRANVTPIWHGTPREDPTAPPRKPRPIPKKQQ